MEINEIIAGLTELSQNAAREGRKEDESVLDAAIRELQRLQRNDAELAALRQQVDTLRGALESLLEHEGGHPRKWADARKAAREALDD